MPGVDGLAATRRIRNLAGSARDVPIVAMTANVLPEQVDDLIRAGMDDHVGKPFKRQDLFATIGRWTEPGARQRHARPVPSAPPEVDPQTLDADVLDGMRLRFGPERVDGPVGYAGGGVVAAFPHGGERPERDCPRRPRHGLGGGHAGLRGVSELCRELEAAAHAGGISPR